MTFFSSIRRDLLVSFTLLALVPMAVITLAVMGVYHRDTTERIRHENVQAARLVTTALDHFLARPVSLLEHVRNLAERNSRLASRQVADVIDEEIEVEALFESVAVVAADGRVRAQGYAIGVMEPSQPALQDFARTAVFRTVHDTGQPAWSEPFVSLRTGNPVVMLALPCQGGMVAGVMNLNHLNHLVEPTRTSTSAYAFIVSRTGLLVAHPDPALVGDREAFSTLPMITAGQSGTGGTYTFTLEGRSVVGSVLPYPAAGWVIVAVHDLDRSFAPVRRLEWLLGCGLLAVVVIAFLLAIRNSRRITAPIVTLAGFTRKMAAGEYEVPALQSQYAEIADLHETFEHMARAVQEREQELQERNRELATAEEGLRFQVAEYHRAHAALRESKERYRTLFTQMLTGFAHHEILCDEAGRPVDYRYLSVNPAFELMTGKQEQQVVGKTVHEVFPGIEDSWIRRYGAVALTGRPDHFESHVASLGKYFEVLAYRPAPGEFAVTFTDITERKQAEAELLARNTELQTLNRISQIVLSASDLDETCRAIAAEISQTTEFPIVTIEIYDAGRQVTELRGVAGIAAADFPRELPVATSLSRQVLASGEPLVDSQVSRRPDYATSQLSHLAVETFISLPMLTSRGIIGTVNLASTERFVPQESFVQWARSTANYIALLIDRVKADEELRLLNRELEQRIMERTFQLQLANQELESFSYSVSHDLRAPLRHINGFSRLLIEEQGEVLTPEGLDHLARIGGACERMGRLIDDLLELSRVSRHEMQNEQVNLSRLVTDAVQDLQDGAPQRQVRVTVAEGVLVQGDNRLLQIAVRNLVENAWKYSAREPRADIEFGVRRQTDGPVYFVRDNGAGFDMAYAGKLFSPFQRLHGSEFEGTGIGLATVQRIVRRHGGRVWAEASVGQGATFYFTLGSS
ncbi:MAG TPA: ATP-binding protein [Geobacteraceae bacterium]